MKHSILFILIAILSGCSFLSPPNNKDTMKIYLADDVLQYSNELQIRESVQMEKKIEKAVSSYGNRPNDLKILNQVIATRKATSDALEQLSKIRQELIQATGGYVESDPTKHYKASNDVATVTSLMVTNKKGLLLKKMMDNYVDEINKIGGRKYPYFALEPKDDRRINDTSIIENYETYYFENTTLGMALMHISYIEFDVIMVQKSCLSELADLIAISN